MTQTDMLSTVSMRFVDSMDEANAFWKWLNDDRNRALLAFDLETTGLSPENDRIRLFQLGDTQQGWAIPFEDSGTQGGWAGLARQAFQQYQGQLVGHNIGFDFAFWKAATQLEPPWHRAHDTMLQAHCLDPTRSVALKSVTALELDPTAAAAQQILHNYMGENKLTWETIPVNNPYYWGYGGLDTIITARLHDVQYPRIQQSCLDAYNLEMAVYRVCSNMQRYGLRVDPAYCDTTAKQLRAYAQQLKEWCTKEFSIDNIGSPLQLIKYFKENGFAEEVVIIDEKTGKQKESADKNVLSLIAHPLADAVLAYRTAQQRCGNYLEKFPTLMDTSHIIRPDINTCGARTARMSIRNPSFQNLPKNDKSVRNGVIPREDHQFVTCDADQIEMRILAHFAQDEGLRDAFTSPHDFFCKLASEIFGDSSLLENRDDPRRGLTKNRTYAKNYGAGDAKIAKTNRVPLDNVKRINALFDQRYPNVTPFMNAVSRQADLRERQDGRGYITSYGGRRIFTDRGKGYTGTNYLIQSWAAAIFKRCVVDLDSAGLGPYMVLPVHDEIVADVPRDMVEQAAHDIPKIMTNATAGEFYVPLSWSSTILPGAWGGRELG